MHCVLVTLRVILTKSFNKIWYKKTVNIPISVSFFECKLTVIPTVSSCQILVLLWKCTDKLTKPNKTTQHSVSTKFCVGNKTCGNFQKVGFRLRNSIWCLYPWKWMSACSISSIWGMKKAVSMLWYRSPLTVMAFSSSFSKKIRANYASPH